jgi:4-carboxymuconolactone decarboxylase
VSFAYPDLDALPAELRDAVTQRGSLNVYRMIMHSPGLAPGFLELASAVLQANSLPADWRELAILRVGHAYGAGYEVHHHENLARWAGLEDAAITAWTDELLANHTLGDEPLALLTVTQLADLVITVGFYQLVCNFLNTFDVTTVGEGGVS